MCGNLDCLFDPSSPTCEWDEFGTCADDPCAEPIPWCFDRPDWVFAGGDWVDTVITGSSSYAWSAASTSCAADPDAGVTKFYAGTLLLEVPLGAQGTYTVDFVDDPNHTLMTTCVGVIMAPITRVSAQLSISCATGEDCDDGNTCTEDACEAFLSAEGTASTCLWADVNCDGFVNVTDVQLLQLGFQGIFEFATLIQLDIHPCYPQGIINVSDIQRVVLAIQGQTYDEIGCRVPCPF